MKFEVGMKVISMTMGEGECFENGDNPIFNIRVKFSNGREKTFLSDGREYDDDIAPSIYPIGTKFTIEPPELTFNKGEVVEVRDSIKEEWVVDRFEYYDPSLPYPYVCRVHKWKCISKLTNPMGEE